jgi:hypothetical protein
MCFYVFPVYAADLMSHHTIISLESILVFFLNIEDHIFLNDTELPCPDHLPNSLLKLLITLFITCSLGM